LEGCGQIAEAVVTWPSVDPGAYAIRVHVDSTGQIAEAVESDNELSGLILVGTYRVNLPLVLRAWPPG
jgi:subtilase family serine protease